MTASLSASTVASPVDAGPIATAATPAGTLPARNRSRWGGRRSRARRGRPPARRRGRGRARPARRAWPARSSAVHPRRNEERHKHPDTQPVPRDAEGGVEARARFSAASSPPKERPMAVPTRPRRVLVVSNETVEAEILRETIAAHARTTQVVVVAPALNTRWPRVRARLAAGAPPRRRRRRRAAAGAGGGVTRAPGAARRGGPAALRLPRRARSAGRRSGGGCSSRGPRCRPRTRGSRSPSRGRPR
jgi:hypothetical protein